MIVTNVDPRPYSPNFNEPHYFRGMSTSQVLLQLLNVGVIFLDTELQCQYVNQFAASVVQKIPQDLLGLGIIQILKNIFSDDTNTKIKTALIDTLETGRQKKLLTLPLNTGQGLYFDLEFQRVESPENDILGMLITFIDITLHIERKESLRQSAHEILSTALKISPLSMSVRNVETEKYTMINKDFEDMTGFSQEEVLGKTAKDLKLFPDNEKHEQRVKKIYEQGFFRNLEITLKTKNGNLRSGLSSSSLFELDGKKHWLTAVQDVTGIRKSEREFERIFNLSLDIMAVFDFNGIIKNVNPAAKKILEYEQEELIGKKLSEFIHFEDVERTKKAFKFTNDATTIRPYTNRCLCKNGNYKWLEWTVVHYPEEKLSYSIARDVTDKKYWEEQLDLLGNIVESSHDAVISGDLDGTILSWNPAAERIYGYKKEEIIGKHVSIVAPENLKGEVSEFLQILAEGKIIQGQRVKRETKDGKTIYLSINSYPIINDEGQIYGFCTISRDITNEYLLEKEMARLDRLNLVGQMAASIGHEIRNPMTCVKGFIQLFEEKADKEEQKFYRLMVDELDRANSIVTEFLTLASNKVSNRNQNSLNSIVKTIEPLLRAEALGADKNLVIDLHEIPDVMLDESEIRQMIINLFKNGMEAMEPGGTLTIFTRDSEGEVLLGLKDQGCGISKDVIDQLGTPFVTTKNHGTGLGLPVCYSIAKRHNAVICFETGQKGTTFTVHFQKL